MGLFGDWQKERRARAATRTEAVRRAAREGLLVAPREEIEAIVIGHYQAQGHEVRHWEFGGDLDLELIDGGSTVLLQLQNWRDIRMGDDRVVAIHQAGIDFGAARTILVTAGTFTWSAEKLAARLGVELLDGDGLLRIRSGEGVGPAGERQAYRS